MLVFLTNAFGKRLGAAVVAVVLSGCAGQAQTSMPAGGSASDQALGGSRMTPQGVSWDHHRCHYRGDIQVDPCHVHFSGRKDYPVQVQVSVQHPNWGSGGIQEWDNCGDKASVRGSGSNWTISPGHERGRCHAVFSYGHHHGDGYGDNDWAKVGIRNNLRY